MASVDNLGFIPTKSSLLKRKAEQEFKVVTYESYKPKQKKIKEEKQMQETKTFTSSELDMKRARHEIIKFGMSGFDPEKKEEAKVQLAISLGAKPPKNKYKNYKQLKQEKLKELDEQTKRLEFQQLGKNQLGKSTAKGKFFKRKKEKGGLLDHYGKPSLKEVTTFKNKQK